MLADHPRHIPTCARWEHEEWERPLDETLPDFAEARVNGLPLTLIALDPSGAAAGMVSLWLSDCPLRPDITPWLASLYVAPAARGQGLGNALLALAEAEARHLGLPRLHLMTDQSEAHYAAHGWTTFERFEDCGPMAGVVLMRKDF
jgi:GNAT superfamily N-acetyltransferase